MIRITCLHTAQSNVPIFDAALKTAKLPHVQLRHIVRADLLAAAEQQGHLTPEIAKETIEVLKSLCSDADAILLTCSTLGPAAEAAADAAAIPIIRVDAALAGEAVKAGGKITVLCAAETTIEPTRQLFEAEARKTGAEITIQLVPGAWTAFKGGNHDQYLNLIAQAAAKATHSGATRVALAQASMAPARDLAPPEARPLNSPMSGLKAAATSVRPTP